METNAPGDCFSDGMEDTAANAGARYFAGERVDMQPPDLNHPERIKQDGP